MNSSMLYLTELAKVSVPRYHMKFAFGIGITLTVLVQIFFFYIHSFKYVWKKNYTLVKTRINIISLLQDVHRIV